MDSHLRLSSAIFGDIRQSLAIFGDLQRSLAIFGDFRRSLAIFGSLPRSCDLWHSLTIFGDLRQLLKPLKCIEIQGNGLILMEIDMGIRGLKVGSGVSRFPGLVILL